MANRNLREIIGEIKSSQDIVDYIQSAAVSLKPSSAGKFKGLCPFHGEKSPSFTVDSNFQNYKCFGCSASGDIVSFVQEYENLSFIEAIRKLCELANIEFEMEESGERFDYKSIKDCAKASASFFVKNFRKLDDDHRAKREVEDRGLPLDGMMYGYAPEGRQNLYKYLSGKGFTDEIILQTGVCTKFPDSDKLFDFWHGRLMFVITDPTGNPVGFSGRKLFDEDKRGKYVNSPDGPIFDKSSVLFHHSEAKKAAKDEAALFVAEGQFDVAAVAASGLPNVVAASGTAFTRKQLLMCSRMVGETGRVVFCFDGDEPGKKAAYRAFSLAGDLQGQCYVASLPEGEDPCDFRLREGDEKLREILTEGAVPIVEFVLDVIGGRFDLRDPSQASRYVEEAATVLKTIASPSLRSTYAKRVALKSLMSISAIEDAISRAKASDELPKNNRPPRREEENGEDERPTREQLLSVSQKEEKFLASLEENELLEIYARLMQLAFHERSFLDRFAEMEDCPKPFKVIAAQAAALPPGTPIIAESFKLPLIVEAVIEEDYLPHLKHMDEDDVKELFEALVEESTDLIQARKLERESRRIMEILKDSSDPELLKTAATEAN